METSTFDQSNLKTIILLHFTADLFLVYCRLLQYLVAHGGVQLESSSCFGHHTHFKFNSLWPNTHYIYFIFLLLFCNRDCVNVTHRVK